MPWYERFGWIFWSLAILAAGFLPAVLVAPHVAPLDGRSAKAAAPQPEEAAQFEGPVPDPFVVPGDTPLAHEVSWRDLSASRPAPEVRAWATRAARACMRGPLIADTPAVKASAFPFNYCACLTLSAIESYSLGELRQLHPVLAKGHRPENWAYVRWIGVERRCSGISSQERLYPTSSGVS